MPAAVHLFLDILPRQYWLMRVLFPQAVEEEVPAGLEAFEPCKLCRQEEEKAN
jgi:hypothetical protein